MTYYKTILLVFILALGLVNFSCSGDDTHDHEAGDGHDHETEAPAHEGENEGGHEAENKMHLTKRQTNAIHLELGDFSEIKINDYIKATGMLGLPPDAYSSVSAKAEGFVKSSRKYVEGSMVKKGATIAYLENPMLIEKQEAFLSAHAELTFLQQELDRQQSLVNQNAGVERDLQKLKADVAMKKAEKLGAEKYLNYVGISTKNVLDGTFIQRIPIIAPLTGFITSIDMHNGMYVTPEQQLLEIVSDEHMHLELNVFERDIAQVKEDQKISYIVPALGNKSFTGEVHVIGKEFDPHTKTVRIHGHSEGEKPPFIKDLFISAKIWLNDQKVMALPEEAIVKDGENEYIYVTNNSTDDDEMLFEKIMVQEGVTDNGYVAITLMEELPKDVKIVLKGSYFIYAQSKYGEAEHEH